MSLCLHSYYRRLIKVYNIGKGNKGNYQKKQNKTSKDLEKLVNLFYKM